MQFYSYRNLCVSPMGGTLPGDAREVSAPFAPLYFLVDRPGGRGLWKLRNLGELLEPEGPALLLPLADPDPALGDFLARHGAGVVNTAYPTALAVAEALWTRPGTGLRLTLVGLGDVGGTLLTGLKLLGGDLISEIRVWDPREALISRYEMELNQVLDRPLPRIVPGRREDLFDCDVFLFTASRGVPPLGTQGDVRLLQLAQNKELIKDYVNQAAAAGFTGLFCQISDPVDLLCRSACLQGGGTLLPEQLRGFGLGVMKARAAYAAEKLGADFSHGAAFGPHGADLVIANHPTAYDDALSRQLTQAAVSANLRVRDLGFKPYIAPALSSACLSLLNTLRGDWSLTTVPLDGIYFGCENRLTRQGSEVRRQPLDPALLARIQETWTKLKEADALCRP